MELFGMKAANMIFKTNNDINLYGQEEIDKVVEKVVEEQIKIVINKVNDCNNGNINILDKCKAAIEKALTEDGNVKEQIENIRNKYQIYVPEYDPETDTSFKIIFHRNMLEIKLDKYVLFFELKNMKDVEKLEKLKGIKMSDSVIDKRIRISFTHEKEHITMEVRGKEVKPVSITIGPLIKIYVFKSDVIKLRTPEEQIKRRTLLKNIEDEKTAAKKRKNKMEFLKDYDKENPKRFGLKETTRERIKNIPGSN